MSLRVFGTSSQGTGSRRDGPEILGPRVHVGPERPRKDGDVEMEQIRQDYVMGVRSPVLLSSGLSLVP